MITHEQASRDMLERMGIENAQNFSSGEIIELANKLREIEQLRQIENAFKDGFAAGYMRPISDAMKPSLDEMWNEYKARIAAPQQEQEGEGRE